MNTDRELMQQALEALTTYDGTNGESKRKRVLAALRERLAQPEQEPVAHTLNCVCGAVWDVSPDGVEEMVHAPVPAQRPEQEPFGYFRYDLRLDAWVQNREEHPGIPFYTAPPQRKPLTPQSPCEMTQAEGRMFKLGWLECEAAHGIGEKSDAA